MTLSPEQKQTVATWIAAGDNLSAVQKKLSEQFKLSMTYRDVRFLVDDLNLELTDPAPKVDTSDITKVRSAKAVEKIAPADADLSPAPSAAAELDPDDDVGNAETDLEDSAPAGASTLSVSVDKVTLLPGAIASGTVTFSDGVTGKWVVDQYGRPGFTEVSQPGYRPTPADGQAFMRQLGAALQQRGL